MKREALECLGIEVCKQYLGSEISSLKNDKETYKPQSIPSKFDKILYSPMFIITNITQQLLEVGGHRSRLNIERM